MIPRVSVVMPVHNGLAHLDESIETILAQTFTNFEFVIGDNGSSDGTLERLREWSQRDNRIRLLEHPDRLGPTRSSNWVVDNARADFIARMDADDIASPRRLERQLAAFEHQPDAEMIGTLYSTMDEDGRSLRPPPVSRLELQSPSPPFCHPTIMFKREAFYRIGGYRAEAEYWEDADLFWRFAEAGCVYVLPEPLITVRHSRRSSRYHEQQEVDEAVNTFHRALAAYTRGADPFHLLTSPEFTDSAEHKLLPRTFVSRAAHCVWAGQRPDVLRRMRHRAALRFDQETLFALTYVLCATLSPHSVRGLQLAWFKWTNRGTGKVSEQGLMRWRPRGYCPTGRHES